MVEYNRKKIQLQNGGTRNYYYKINSNGKKERVTKEQYLRNSKKGGNITSYIPDNTTINQTFNNKYVVNNRFNITKINSWLENLRAQSQSINSKTNAFKLEKTFNKPFWKGNVVKKAIPGLFTKGHDSEKILRLYFTTDSGFFGNNKPFSLVGTLIDKNLPKSFEDILVLNYDDNGLLVKYNNKKGEQRSLTLGTPEKNMKLVELINYLSEEVASIMRSKGLI